MSAKRCLFMGIVTLLSLSLAASAQPVEHPLTGEPLVIDCLRGTPEAIDGDLSDWNLAAMTPAVLDTEEQLSSGNASWDNPDDSSGEFYLLWDDENVYIAVVMVDEKLSMNKTGSSIWNADCIEVLFATTDAIPTTSPPSTIHYQYGFNANEQRWNWCNMDGNTDREPDYLEIAASETPDGYICEVAIPHGEMESLDFSVGNTIGFHPVFDDTDNGDRELQMTWSGLEAHDQSQGFGHMILTDATVIGGANALARRPDPRDGEMIVPIAAILQWQAGAFAAAHEVYIGTDADAVEAATPDDADLFVGRLAVTRLTVGAPGGPYPEGLVPGTTYYWRVDEVNDVDPNSPWKGNVWSFSVQPAIAFNPFPPDGMKHVGLDQDLSWSAAANTFFHTIYFGQSFEEVDSAAAGGWMSVQPTYDPGPLELSTTYYWRVDEFKGATTDTGQVWSFTTRGDEGGVQAEYFAGMALAGDPVLTQVEGTIDHSWSGEVAAGLEDQVSARWRADLEAPFTETYKLITTSDDGVRLWLDGRLIIDNWIDQSPTDNSARVDLVAGQIYRIVMEYYENTGGATAQLSWESDTLPRQIIPQGWLQLPVKATGPSPVHDAPHADQDPALSWTAGDGATGHQVYFGDDADAVAGADTSTAGIYRGQQAAGVTTYNPGSLEWGKTYYWRVDEVNADGVAAGALWCFTTADFVIIDDFESYDNEVGSRPFEAWVDGVGFTLPEPGHPGNGSNALVGHDIWTAGSPHYNGLLMETRIVHGGLQAMPVGYNNVESPFYSEIERTWATARNWTVNGVDTLKLYVRGSSANGPDRLYVALSDSAGGSATVALPDTEIVTSRAWTEVKIPLADFTGVNAAAIAKMSVGLGNPPAVGGAGSLLFDDFRVTVGE